MFSYEDENNEHSLMIEFKDTYITQCLDWLNT